MLITTLLLLASAPQTALASTTRDTQLPQDASVADHDLFVRHESRPGSQLYWPSSAWFYQLGDQGSDSLLDLPPGIDALSYRMESKGHPVRPRDFLFSTDSNYAGFLDGDVLRMREGKGLELVLAEDDFVAALGVQSGSFDLDALTGDSNLVIFSVKDDLQTSLLGQVRDGDVLIYDVAAGAVYPLYTEDDIQDLVDQADPLAGPIGDLRSLSNYPATGELVFTVQAPTANDATVYGDGAGAGGRLLPLWSEADWGFQVESELDALTFVIGPLQDSPVLRVDVPYASPGQSIKLKLAHATPLGRAKGIFTRRRGYEVSTWGGIGVNYLHQDNAVYQRQWLGGWMHATAIDASGSADFDWKAPDLPVGRDYVDHYFQILDLETQALSNPIVVRVR